MMVGLIKEIDEMDREICTYIINDMHERYDRTHKKKRRRKSRANRQKRKIIF